MNVAEESFRTRLEELLNGSEGFARETRWFDGSILLEAGAAQCWLKVYRGRVIDSLDFAPPLGYTFKIAGSAQGWAQLTSGDRTFADLTTPGVRYFANADEVEAADPFAAPDLRIEGNVMEARRIHEALFHLADCIVASAN